MSLRYELHDRFFACFDGERWILLDMATDEPVTGLTYATHDEVVAEADTLVADQ